MMHTWRHTGRLALIAITVACAPLGAQQTTTPTTVSAPAARPPDVASPEAVVTALYDVISGPAAQPRDWDRFRSLFRPDARLSFIQRGPAGQERLHSLTLEDFIRLAGPGYQSGAGFWEREIGQQIDRFGSIANVFTTYETRLTAVNGPVSERGINSVQQIRYQDRWWITNLVFDSETAANPIPPEYVTSQDE